MTPNEKLLRDALSLAEANYRINVVKDGEPSGQLENMQRVLAMTAPGDHMDVSKTVDLAELRRLAEAATGGKWTTKFDQYVVPEAHADRHIGGSTEAKADYEEYAHQICAVRCKYLPNRANAAYIAACSPATILALLDALEILRKDLGLQCMVIASKNAQITNVEQALADAQSLAPVAPQAASEQEAFEAWYYADAARQGMDLQEGIAHLRDGDGYGDNRIMLNGKWQGWQARAALTPAAQDKVDWISVDEWLPELHTVVVLRNEKTQMNVPFDGDIDWHGAGYLSSHGSNYWSVFGESRGMTMDSVTHWMPLPPAPKAAPC